MTRLDMVFVLTIVNTVLLLLVLFGIGVTPGPTF